MPKVCHLVVQSVPCHLHDDDFAGVPNRLSHDDTRPFVERVSINAGSLYRCLMPRRQGLDLIAHVSFSANNTTGESRCRLSGYPLSSSLRGN